MKRRNCGEKDCHGGYGKGYQQEDSNDNFMNMDEHIKFWIESSEDDFQAMIHLCKKGHNTWALFIGHLVLEKLLKAWFIKKNSGNPPFIHDLVRLSEKGILVL